MTCRSASAACSRTPTPKRWRSPRGSMRSTSSAARSKRACRASRWPRSAVCASRSQRRRRATACACSMPDWHQGVVGLVASRIKDRVRRPVIAFARNADGTLRGSARSVPGVHIRDVLDGIATRHPELISRFGGHAMAAGLSIEERHLDAFARAFDDGSDALARSVHSNQSRRRPMASSRATRSRSKPRRRCATAAPGARLFPSPASTACSPSRTRAWSATSISRCG